MFRHRWLHIFLVVAILFGGLCVVAADIEDQKGSSVCQLKAVVPASIERTIVHETIVQVVEWRPVEDVIVRPVVCLPSKQGRPPPGLGTYS
ncbi:MAG: hypothetical protein HQL18_05135 [Candidatus Omnitrophica bacterium]|nr:hypothetical protein [Candidatus Omnitrophota bacterium]